MAIALFPSRHVKEAKLLSQHARKLLHRRRDVMSEASIADVETEIDGLDAAIAADDERAIRERSDSLDKVFATAQPPRADAGWQENCEVLLVAFVLAIAIRAYFLQPFKIPTGSMEPTLNGIIGHPLPMGVPLPGAARQLFESLWLGRSYVDAVSQVDDQVTGLVPETRFGFFSYTRIECASGRSYVVHAPPETLTHPTNADGFGIVPLRYSLGGQYLPDGYKGRFRAGEPIARGYVDTGDQVFVDKFTYNFRLPKRSDVFVFSTLGITDIRMDDPNIKSQFYIKRLAGVPGDELRIDQPHLFINGGPAQEPGFRRVMTGPFPYRGYSNTVGVYLRSAQDTFDVPAKSYFALGDNSFNSSDSRKFGIVPADNVVGRGLFVYWPFTRHWGPIH